MTLADFLRNLYFYTVDMAPALAIGFLVSGFIHEIIPGEWITRYLSGKGAKPLLYATLAGILLPVCCLGSLPIALAFRKRGATLGPILSFLVATPATSLTAILVTYSLLGLKFTIFLCASVVCAGMLAGVIGNKMDIRRFDEKTAVDPVCGVEVSKDASVKLMYRGNDLYFCSEKCAHAFMREKSRKPAEKLKRALKSSADMVKDMWLELLIGLLLAALISSFNVISKVISMYLYGYFAYLFSAIFGLLMYICSTASVPLVHAFIYQGLDPGAGLVMLILGPVTSYGALLVVWRKFGLKVLSAYLVIVITTSIVFGYLYSLMI